MRKRWIFFSAVYVMLFLGYWTKINVGAVAAQLPPVNSCSDVRFLMSQNITPYDLPLGGGTLTARGGANGRTHLQRDRLAGPKSGTGLPGPARRGVR